MKILVAEDDRITALLIENILTDWGYEPIMVENGTEALAILTGNSPPQLVLLDWMLPGITGPAICRHIRTLNREEYIYIILLSCRDLAEDLITGMNAGADDYIIKPFNHEELQARLLSGERVIQQENELRMMLARLLESGKVRDRFIAALTHDLRTPLNAQRMALEVLANKCRAAQHQECVELVEAIAESNQDMLKLVNHMLEACHLESEQAPLKRMPLYVEELAEQCCTTLAPLAAEKNIQLNNLIAPHSLPPVAGDGEQIRRVLHNLIGNAISHIPAGCQIEVIGFEREQRVHIQVRDNGPGIPADTLPHLFDRYYTGTGRLPRKVGTGLGLSICKNIVEQHGGTIGVESVLGQGASFEFILPTYLSAAPTPESALPLPPTISQPFQLQTPVC